MSGIDIRVNKIFNGKKNLVISALDHVMEYGDQPGIEDSEQAILRCMDTDALLMSRFMLKRHASLFKSRNAPVPVVRINWSSSFYYPLDYRGGFTRVATTVEDAVQAGGEVIICSLFLENENEQMETENVEIFSEIVRQKEKLGIPLIGECYLVEHKDKTPEQNHLKVKRITRVMTELGADLIKCFITNNFQDVVNNLPVPAFTIGAEKLNNDLDVLKKAAVSVAQGARGIIFGRNIFMADNPRKLVKALNEVMNDGVSPEEAYKKL
jgi:DhnA family fructose-bisphosphate aldolase class Ia